MVNQIPIISKIWGTHTEAVLMVKYEEEYVVLIKMSCFRARLFLWGLYERRFWCWSVTDELWSSPPPFPCVLVGTTAAWRVKRPSFSCSPARRPASWSGTASRTAASTLSPSSEYDLAVQPQCLQDWNASFNPSAVMWGDSSLLQKGQLFQHLPKPEN